MRHGEKKLFRRSIALLLALSLALGLAGCGGTGMGARAATMFLRKTEGAVTVSDDGGQSVEPAENLGLYSGYGVGTEAESLAWIDLDKVKLAKLNENSEAAITKDGTLEVRELTFEWIPAFVAREILDDEALQQTVLEASGLRIPTTYEELADILEDVVYSEEIDFEADGSPELLVIQDGTSDGRFSFRIYRMGPEGPEVLAGSIPIGVTNAARYACSLAERDGRLFVHLQTDGTDSFGAGMFFDVYYGSCAQQDGGREDWGRTD